MYLAGLTAFLALVVSPLVQASTCPSIPPPPGLTCYHEEPGVRLSIFYGDVIWWHGWHVRNAGCHDKDFGISTPEERDARRVETTKRLVSGGGFARDEKPLARQAYDGEGSVCRLPGDESSREGGYTKIISDFDNENKGKPVVIRLMDNRKSQTEIPPGHPKTTPQCSAPERQATPRLPGRRSASPVQPRPPITDQGSGSSSHRRPRRDELPFEIDGLHTRSSDDTEYPALDLLERDLDEIVEDFIHVKRQLDIMDRLERRYDSLLLLEPRDDEFLEYFADFVKI